MWRNNVEKCVSLVKISTSITILNTSFLSFLKKFDLRSQPPIILYASSRVTNRTTLKDLVSTEPPSNT